MEYFNKFRSTVTQVAATVSNALPGNPLTREYDVGDQIGTAGQGLYWKLFKGSKKSSKQAVTIWLFDKKDMERWPRDDKELFLSVIKKGVSQLTRLRHPRLLVIEHGIEESRDSLAFATEPIFGSLANCLGKTDNMQGPLPPQLKDFKPLEIEVKHGLLQIGEALAFLHIDAKMLHRNVCPESVIINERGAWKLGGFDFALQGTAGSNGQMTYETMDWNERIPSLCQPCLDYLAPEYIMGGAPYCNSDIFALGALAHAVFNECRPPLSHKNALDKYKRNVDKLKSFPQQFCENIPAVFKEDFKMCLNYSPDLRPDATQFTKIAYFDDPLVKALNYFESLMQMDNNQKMQFFKSLPAVLCKFEKRPLLQKVMPWLAGEFATPDLIPFILPSVFHITEQSSKREFTDVILPSLVPVFCMERPYQIALLLLQRMELLLEKSHEEDIKRYILPLIYNSISSETTRIQELCLSIVPNIGKLVDRNSMKTHLLPKLLKLATDGGVLMIRVQALVCLGKLLPTLESWMVTEQILPTLPKINSKEPGLLMAILGIYKLSFESESLTVGREQLAKSALPFLMATSVENTLNLSQFEQYMALIKTMLTKVETEQRQRLQQLSAGQEDQRSVPNFDEVLKPSSSSNNLPKSLEGLVSGDNYGGSTPTSGVTNRVASNRGVLSMEEKKRLAARQETGEQPTVPVLPKPVVSQSNPLAASFHSMSLSGGNTNTATAPSSLGGFFDPIVPSSSSSISSSNRMMDLSDFLPPSSNNAVPTSFSTPGGITGSNASQIPSMSASFSGPVAPVNTTMSFGAFGNNSSGMMFPQPPKSSNVAVQRPGGQQSSLDTLLSFPAKQKMPINSMNGLAAAPPANGPGPAKDLFADLLG